MSCLTSDVVVVSPNTYFNFTPLLAGTAVGTLEFRCAIEPVSSISEYLGAILTHIRLGDMHPKWSVSVQGLRTITQQFLLLFCSRHTIKPGAMR